MRAKEGQGSTQAEVQGQALNKTQLLGLHDVEGLQRQTKAANERESLSCSIEEEGEDEEETKENEEDPYITCWSVLRFCDCDRSIDRSGARELMFRKKCRLQFAC